MTHATPCHVSDVQQTVDTAQVNERAVIGDIFNHALNDRTFLQVFEQFLTIFAHAGFEHSTTRHHHVVTLTIELDDLEFHGLAFERRCVFHRTQINQRAWQEGTNACSHDSQAAFDFTGDGAGNQFVFLE